VLGKDPEGGREDEARDGERRADAQSAAEAAASYESGQFSTK
jgi:hypothetical protein